MVSTIINF